MNRLRHGAAALLVVGVLVFATACDPARPARPPSKGAAVVGDPDGIFRPGRAGENISGVRIQSLQLDEDDKRVIVKFSGGNIDCWSLERVQVDFQPNLVLVALYGGYHDIEGVFCTTEGHSYELQIRLNQPVSGRPLKARDLG
jgi:hypothetical protein